MRSQLTETKANIALLLLVTEMVCLALGIVGNLPTVARFAVLLFALFTSWCMRKLVPRDRRSIVK